MISTIGVVSLVLAAISHFQEWKAASWFFGGAGALVMLLELIGRN